MKRLLGLAITVFAAGAAVALAQEPTITVTPPPCIPPFDKMANALVQTTVSPQKDIVSVRVYFHADGQDLVWHAASGRMKTEEDSAFIKDKNGQLYFHPPFHEGDRYQEMKQGNGDSYWSLFPKVAPGTTGVSFHITVVDKSGHQYSSPEQSVAVSTNCPAPELTSDQKKYARNLVEGLTEQRQSAVPPGFLCDGIVSFITTDGKLQPNEECRKCACLFAPVYWVTGAAVLAGGVVVYDNRPKSGGPSTPVSSARPH